jgi:hypothetical protein
MCRNSQMHDYPSCKGERITFHRNYGPTSLQSAVRMGVDILSIDGFECATNILLRVSGIG